MPLPFTLAYFTLQSLVKTRVTSTAAVLALAPCGLQQNIETIIFSANCPSYEGNYSHCC